MRSNFYLQLSYHDSIKIHQKPVSDHHWMLKKILRYAIDMKYRKIIDKNKNKHKNVGIITIDTLDTLDTYFFID
jgi:hypothetical protein